MNDYDLVTEMENSGGRLEQPEKMDLLQLISDCAEDIILVIDESRSISFNSGGPRKPETFFSSGKPLRRFVTSDIYEILKDPVENVFKSGKPCCIESRIKPDIWLHTRLTPLCNGSERIISVLAIVRDISELKQKEKLISSSRKELLQAIDSMPYMFAVVDSNHRIKRANKALADHLGIGLPELLGRICYRTFGAAKPHPLCPLERPGTECPGNSMEVLTNYEGKPFLVSISALADEDGNTAGCLHVIRNITDAVSVRESEQKNAEQMKSILKKAERIITIQDPKGKYLKLSAMPGNICLPESIMGKTPFDFFEHETAAAIYERIRRVIDTGKDLTASVKLKIGGDVWHFLDHVSLIVDGAGVVSSIITISEKIKIDREQPDALFGEQHELTRREHEVLQLISSGFTTSQIATKLFISKKTVDTHRARIMQKLDIHKTSSLVRYAVKSGLF